MWKDVQILKTLLEAKNKYKVGHWHFNCMWSDGECFPKCFSVCPVAIVGVLQHDSYVVFGQEKCCTLLSSLSLRGRIGLFCSHASVFTVAKDFSLPFAKDLGHTCQHKQLRNA